MCNCGWEPCTTIGAKRSVMSQHVRGEWTWGRLEREGERERREREREGEGEGEGERNRILKTRMTQKV